MTFFQKLLSLVQVLISFIYAKAYRVALFIYIMAKRVEINLNDQTRKIALFVRIIRAHDCAIYNYITFGDFY